MEMHPELVEFAKEADEQMARDYHEGFFRMSEKLRSLVCGTDVLSQVAAAELRKNSWKSRLRIPSVGT
ncbi:hypothetical protein GDR29_23125 [Xanthomonas oryzae pv. oryzae]|nr:hypothetical protein GDR29_23125 [Xanthomonas oryzae pv. oryzae]